MNLHKIIKASIFLVLIIHSVGAISQNSSISGVVSSASGPEPLVLVYLENTNYSSTSDSQGRYLISNISAGTYTIRTKFFGFISIAEKITLKEGEQLVRDFKLLEDVFLKEGVVVSGTRYEQDRINNPIVVNVLDSKLFNATQSITVSDGLAFQPGVRVEANCQNCGFTQVRMNGLDGAYSQILINSRPIFSALNSVYGLEQIPTNIIERVEVVRSGGSALYGSNAIGGTINIITRDPLENAWELRSNTALIGGSALDQSFNLNGSIVSESMTGGITFYGMSRNRDSYDANGDGFTELVELNNTVFGTKAFYKPSLNSKITLDFSALEEYRRGGDRLELAPHLTDITEQLDHTTYFGGLTYDQWSKNRKTKISAYTSVQHTRRFSYYGGLGGGRTFEDSLLASNAYGQTIDFSLIGGVQMNHYFGNRSVFTLGVENQFYDTDDRIVGYNRLIDQQVNTTGIFSQFEWKPNTKFTALIGARYDISDIHGVYEVGDISNNADVNIGVLSPRLTLLYKIRENLRLRGGYARGFRAPQAFNEDLHISSVSGEPLFVILSQDLDKESSNAFTASLNYTREVKSIQYNFLLEGFYTQLINPFTQVSTGAVLPNGSIVEEVRNGEGAQVSGLNFEAGIAPNSKFAFQIGGTFQQALYNEEQVIFDPEGGAGERISTDRFLRNPNLYGYLSSYYHFTKNFTFDLTGAVTGPMLVPRVIDEDGTIQLIDSNPFFDFNLKASYHFELSADFHLELSGGMRNLFNSFQAEFSSGATRDSDFIYGPLAPRSIFFSLKISNRH